MSNGCFPYPSIDLGEHVCRNVLLTHWAFAYSNSGLANGGTSPPLTAQADSAVGGNGIHGLAFPTLTFEGTNYFVDVFFTPAAGQTPLIRRTRRSQGPRLWAQPWQRSWRLGATADRSPERSGLVHRILTLWRGAFTIIGNSLLINPTGPGVSADGGWVSKSLSSRRRE